MPPTARFAVGLACTVLALLGTAFVVVEIPDRVRTYGVLLPPEGLLKVKAPRSGRVERLPVRNGDTVLAGQVILRLSGMQRAPDREPELAARIASLRRELMLLDDAAARQAETAAVRARLNRRRLELIGERIEAAKAEAGNRQEQAAIAAARADRIGRLAAAQAIAADAAADSETTVLSSRASQLAAEQRVLALRDERLTVEQQLVEGVATTAAFERESGARREAILRQIATSELQSTLEITAPRGGVVSGLAVRVGEVVAGGDVVMTVHEPGSRVEARLFLSPDNAGMIRVGQQVELQLLAYPHQFFGTQRAVVTAISTVALPPEQTGADVPLQGPVFVVRARLARSEILVRRRSWPLPPGTAFQADLVRARWPLYRWLLRSVSGEPVQT
jgi:membrane fusion protein